MALAYHHIFCTVVSAHLDIFVHYFLVGLIFNVGVCCCKVDVKHTPRMRHLVQMQIPLMVSRFLLNLFAKVEV